MNNVSARDLERNGYDTRPFRRKARLFFLCPYKPLIADNFLQSVRLLADGMKSFDAHCIRGVEALPARLAELVERSLMLVTALAPHIGYDRAAEVAKRAHRDGITLREAALTLKHVTADEFDRWVKPSEMVLGRSDR